MIGTLSERGQAQSSRTDGAVTRTLDIRVANIPCSPHVIFQVLQWRLEGSRYAWCMVYGIG